MKKLVFSETTAENAVDVETFGAGILDGFRGETVPFRERLTPKKATER